MRRIRKRKQSERKVMLFHIAIILGFIVLITAAITTVSRLTIRKSDEVLSEKVVSLTASLNVQMELNLNSYLSRMETIATLAFAEEDAYKYDATNPSNDEYESINREKKITEKLNSLCIMENFVDYGIVYRNNRTVGKVSNATASTFGDRIFRELSTIVTRQRTNDGWAAGFEGDFKRIYYVKKVHENALLFISFYVSELDNVFDNPENMDAMEIRLVNKDHDIIYSKDSEEIGQKLPEPIAERVKDKISSSALDDEYLVSVNQCNDWLVVCSIPTRLILVEKNDLTTYFYLITGVAAVLAAVVGFILTLWLTRPIKKIVVDLADEATTDKLTGVLNKRSFEEAAKQKLASEADEHRAMLLLDLDNFKGVNDTLGHAMGDKVLEDTGAILMKSFSSENDLLGRVGGDEFCVLLSSPDKTEEQFMTYLEYKCSEICSAYRDNYVGKDGSYKISASIGAAVFPKDGSTYSELFSACDAALYHSKNRGRDNYSLYEPSMAESEAKKQ